MSEAPTIALSVVIPVYRSAATLPELHARLGPALAAISDHYEIIFVDDASPGPEWETLRKLQASDPHTKLIQLRRNSGQQRAVLCGLAHSSGEVVVTMDDDLQQRPEEIALLCDALASDGQDLDVVLGSYGHKQHGDVRALGTWLVKQLSWHTLGIPRELDLTSFRAIRGDVARAAAELRNPNPVVGFFLWKVSHRMSNVRVHHDPRLHGESTYSTRALVSYFMSMLTDYSDLALRAVGYAGLLFAALGALGLVLPGSQSSASLLLPLVSLLGGLTLGALGLVGRYLSRILAQGLEPARGLVRQRIG